MPIYEYSAKEPGQSCRFCVRGFELARRIADAPITCCPRCGAPVIKCVSRPAIGRSLSGLDDRAKSAGFKKLKKVSTGEYEQQY